MVVPAENKSHYIVSEYNSNKHITMVLHVYCYDYYGTMMCCTRMFYLLGEWMSSTWLSVVLFSVLHNVVPTFESGKSPIL